MTSPELVSSADLVVALDYGQFYLHTAEEDPDLAVELVGDALEVGIAQQGGLLVLTSPHQNNFEMPLRIEVWTAEPDADLDRWDEGFEVHLDVGADGIQYESPTVDVTPLPVSPGSYRALITGRGFVTHGWPGSTTPGDEWRIQLWRSTAPVTARRVKKWDGVASTEPRVDASRVRAERPDDDPWERLDRLLGRQNREMLDRGERFEPVTVRGRDWLDFDHEVVRNIISNLASTRLPAQQWAASDVARIRRDARELRSALPDFPVDERDYYAVLLDVCDEAMALYGARNASNPSA